MSGRDPRRDPKPGDEIKKGHRGREVRYVTLTDQVVYAASDEGPGGACSLSAWRRWAKGSVVVQRGAYLGERLLEARVDRAVSREIVAAANKAMDTINAERRRNGEGPLAVATPTEAAAQALVEIALCTLHGAPVRSRYEALGLFAQRVRDLSVDA